MNLDYLSWVAWMAVFTVHCQITFLLVVVWLTVWHSMCGSDKLLRVDTFIEKLKGVMQQHKHML